MGPFQPILRPQTLRPALRAAIAASSPQTATTRALPLLSTIPTRPSSSHATRPPAEIPAPTPFCPDVPTFLKLIGRGLSAHASKFPTWEALFSLNSEQLRELGIEPPRSRRYLIQWRQRFRRGEFGVGGDLAHVGPDGQADLRVLEHCPGGDVARPQRFVVNVPPGKNVGDVEPRVLSRVAGYHVQGARTIVGPFALPVKNGEGASITPIEGMWEDKRGRKIDGGERRRTEVRYKKRVQERREARERGERR